MKKIIKKILDIFPKGILFAGFVTIPLINIAFLLLHIEKMYIVGSVVLIVAILSMEVAMEMISGDR